MITITAKEAKNRLGEYMMESMRSPVAVTHHGKPFVYIVSNRDFAKSSTGFPHAALDDLKHRLSCEVLASFPLKTIRQRSIANLLRWKSRGVSSAAYEEWLALMRDGSDQQVLAAMVGLDEDSNRLRQSFPYAGMLDKKSVARIREAR